MQPRPERGAAFGCVPNVGGATRRGCRSHLRPSGERLSGPTVQRDGHLGLGRGPGTQCIPEEPAEAKEPPGWGEA